MPPPLNRRGGTLRMSVHRRAVTNREVPGAAQLVVVVSRFVVVVERIRQARFYQL